MTMMLVKFEAVKRALAEARSIDEVKQIRDKAETLRLCVKQQGGGLEMQNDMAEIKLWAERQAGELLREMEKAKGAAEVGWKTRSHDVTTLTDWGISKMQSHRWQLEAEVPPEVFERHVAETKAKKEELTSVGLRKLAKKLNREAERQATASNPTPSLASHRLICGDMAEAMPTLGAESIDAIITDPPYPREYLPLYGILAQEAARVLKPGGSLLAMAGQSYLPTVLKLMAVHLRYHWTLAYLTPGGQSPQIWPRKVNAFWKPVLWFVKGDYVGTWKGDVIKSNVNDNDKRFHDWGQSESGMARLVEKFTEPGQIILDPFVGGGTVAVVCERLGRQFIGIDIEQEQIDITLGRLRSG